MKTKPKIKIDIISDVVCPWCYIGKRRLEKAIAQVSDQIEVEVEYHPFELNPDMPAEGRNQKEYLAKKFGSEQKYHQITSQVTATAAEEGLIFDFDKQGISPNTRNAHRLISYAKLQGKQLEMKEALMKAYFTDGVNLTQTENLVAIATQLGLDQVQVTTYLNSNEGFKEVIAEENQNIKRGISGVPFYIINNKHAISGAQPSEVFAEALLNISLEVSPAGEACDVENKDC